MEIWSIIYERPEKAFTGFGRAAWCISSAFPKNKINTRIIYLISEQSNIIKCENIIKDGLGNITEIHCNYQADTRSDPASGYRGDIRGDDLGGAKIEKKDDFSGAGHLQGNPLMPPPGGAGPAPSSPDAGNVEPGVARLQGTIAEPSVGMYYDRVGPSHN